MKKNFSARSRPTFKRTFEVLNELPVTAYGGPAPMQSSRREKG